MPINKWTPNFPIDKKRRVNFSALCIASRYSGKTFFVKWLLQHTLKNKYDLIFVMTTQGDNIEEYSKFVDPKFIFNQYRPDVVQVIMEINSTAEKRANILIICDDIVSRKNKYNDELLTLYTRGRHMGISCIYLSQNQGLCDSSWRNNSDYIFIFKIRSYMEKESICQSIIMGVLDKEFEKKIYEKVFYMNLLKKITNTKYRMLVIDFRESEIFWFKCPSKRNQPKRLKKGISDFSDNDNTQ